MIISASRRTDIPCYYSDWFFNRIKEGFVFVRNPANSHQISKISLSPDIADGFVFWTKNPSPMLDKLHLLKDYAYYFQFTLTPYGRDIEPALPSKSSEIIPTFRRLSAIVGPERVIWRYDPIFLSPKYTADYHVMAFEKIAESLQGYTKKCIISFLDKDYRNVKRNSGILNLLPFGEAEQADLSKSLAEIAHGLGLQIDTCSEKNDLTRYGIGHACCIDAGLFESLLGCRLSAEKDKSQRPDCGCVSSIDIGMYNTCICGCKYCYANYIAKPADEVFTAHNVLSPLLSGELRDGDTVKERKMHSCREYQLRLC
ncbi:MAG: DUF1848 domain-containing protein [Clostridiales bacterium]|nr:DUF1848 domain-containing protein [Clostridiales bacterium]